jgi:hypothetical protein
MNKRGLIGGMAVIAILLSFAACAKNSTGSENSAPLTEPSDPTVSALPYDGEHPNETGNAKNNSPPNVAEGKTSTVPQITSYDEYMTYIAQIPNFKPYYQISFALEGVPGGVANVSIENCIALYEELKDEFDFINIRTDRGRSLAYVGRYDKDLKFVVGHDRNGNNESLPAANPLNMATKSIDGTDITITLLKTVILCENSFGQFDGNVAEGRNLQETDFALNAYDEPIPVVLGSEYRGTYKAGDTFTLMYLSMMRNFEVVGIYEPGLGISSGSGATENADVDCSVVMPNYIPMYEIEDKYAMQHGFHVAELLSGYVAIAERIPDITLETHKQYEERINKLADKYGFNDLLRVPRWPVGLIF